MANYKPSSMSSMPKTLDPKEYFELTPERRRLDEKRLALRAKLKRQYLTMLNDPHRKGPIEDPAVDRWVYARANTYPYFRSTPKTVMYGIAGFVFPVVFLWVLFKTTRDKREEKMKAGLIDRTFHLHS